MSLTNLSIHGMSLTTVGKVPIHVDVNQGWISQQPHYQAHLNPDWKMVSSEFMPYVLAVKRATILANSHSSLKEQISFAEAYYYFTMLLWRRLICLLQANGALPDRFRGEAKMLADAEFVSAPGYFHEYLYDLGNYVNEKGERFRYALPLDAETLDASFSNGLGGMLGRYGKDPAIPRTDYDVLDLVTRNRLMRYAWIPSPYIVALGLQERASRAPGHVNKAVQSLASTEFEPTEFILGITPNDVVDAETASALTELGWREHRRPDDAIGFTNYSPSTMKYIEGKLMRSMDSIKPIGNDVFWNVEATDEFRRIWWVRVPEVEDASMNNLLLEGFYSAGSKSFDRSYPRIHHMYRHFHYFSTEHWLFQRYSWQLVKLIGDGFTFRRSYFLQGMSDWMENDVRTGTWTVYNDFPGFWSWVWNGVKDRALDTLVDFIEVSLYAMM